MHCIKCSFKILEMLFKICEMLFPIFTTSFKIFPLFLIILISKNTSKNVKKQCIKTSNSWTSDVRHQIVLLPNKKKYYKTKFLSY